jgi:hypothetical protein
MRDEKQKELLVAGRESGPSPLTTNCFFIPHPSYQIRSLTLKRLKVAQGFGSGKGKFS